jgi:hypothetical protein
MGSLDDNPSLADPASAPIESPLWIYPQTSPGSLPAARRFPLCSPRHRRLACAVGRLFLAVKSPVSRRHCSGPAHPGQGCALSVLSAEVPAACSAWPTQKESGSIASRSRKFTSANNDAEANGPHKNQVEQQPVKPETMDD